MLSALLLSLVTAIQFSPPFLPSLYSLASAPGTEKALQTKKGRDKRRIKPCCRKQSKQRWARSFCVQSVHFKHDTCFLFLPSFPSASYQWSLADRYTLLLLFPFAGESFFFIIFCTHTTVLLTPYLSAPRSVRLRRQLPLLETAHLLRPKAGLSQEGSSSTRLRWTN